MSAHTKGPWIARDGGLLEGEMVITTQARIDLDMVSICEMDYVFEGEFGLEQEANAKLIAASPTLLETLEKIVEMVDAKSSVAIAAQAAIADVTGRKS